MWIVAGLGNPGREYCNTRHNIGFMIADVLSEKWRETNWCTRFDALIAEYKTAEPVLIVKPQTYMNLSGVAVGAIARWYKVPPEKIISIYDDMDLPVGKIRLRGKGSSGGHRGVESLLVHLGSEAFIRIRVGIGRPPGGWQVVDYVTSRFREEEAQAVIEAINTGAEAVEAVIRQGLVKAMNKINR